MGRTSGKGVSIELVGGLGNQLFTYIAGLYIASRLSTNLTTLVHASIFNSVRRGQGIAAFIGFSGTTNPYTDGFAKSPWTIKLRTFLSVFLTRLGLPVAFAQRLTSIYQSKVVGEDQGIASIREGYSVKGYFQTRKYFEEIRGNLPGDMFHLREPSHWFKNLKTESDYLKPIALHVRRGDYLAEQNSSIGALSAEFFLNGLSFLREDPNFEGREVWVFSNDIRLVQQEFQGRIQGSVRWIDPPSESLDAESLLLLGSADALVISNSTFSWWGAVIGNPRMVLAPSKWFRGAEDPSNLIPPEWHKIESSWL